MNKLLLIVASCLLSAVSLAGANLAAAEVPLRAASPSHAVAAPRVSSVATKPASPSPSSEPGVVNLNDANAEQLALLPGVGPSRAAAIIAYRKSHPFRHLEELTRVKGFGRKSYSRLRPLLSLNGPTTLKERPQPPRLRPAVTRSSAS